MMKKAFFIAVLTLFSLNLLLSQEFRIGFESGLGQYSMNDLKKINDEVISGLPFDAKVVSDFPVYFYYEPMLGLKFKKTGLGLLYSFYSTGSRVSSKDYSGEYRFDLKIKSNSYGFYANHDVWSDGKYNISVSTTFRAMFSKLDASEYFIVNDSVLTDQSVKFEALNYSLEPGVAISRRFSKITLEVNIGYLFSIANKPFHSVENEDYFLQTPVSRLPVEPGWDGFRIGLSVYFTIADKPR